ncbi:malonyl-CoA/methylmalonyl-CoA synthetase [Burkholderiales bacterium]|nr:malonyl-CoA/methylmalonyl-CoA synthetase [Burkholderiales bacterium]
MPDLDSATYASHLEGWARRQPAAPALSAPGHRSMTFSEVSARAVALRGALAAWDIGRGDVVAWPVADRLESAAALAMVPACATLLPLPASLTVDAYARVLARTRAKAVVAPARGGHPIAEAARRHGIAQIAMVPQPGESAGAFALELAREGPSLRQAPWINPDVMYVSATSGTTGHPKLVPHAWRALWATARAMGERLGFGPRDASAHLTTLHLANGLRTAAQLSLLHGGSVVVLPEGDLDAFLRAVEAGEVTYTSSTFAIHREVLKRLEGRAPVARGRLRFLRVGSGRLDPDEMDRLEALFGVPVVTGLSTSETGTVAQQGLPPAPRVRGSVGTPVACEIRIADEHGASLPCGGIGEIQVRGPQVFGGYIDDPGLDAAAFVDGWFRSGDLGRFDEHGDLSVVGRLKETINRGGEKIAPLEIDAVLNAMPGVAEAATFGVPHPTLGEEVVAAVIRAPAATVDAGQLIAGVRAALGERRAPRRIWFVESLPRTGTGKVRRSALPDWVASRDAAPAEETPAARATPLEIAVAALWAAMLRTGRVDVHEDFFMLGGDSLRGAKLLDQVRSAFGVELSVQSLFGDANTIAGMARCIERARSAA